MSANTTHNQTKHWRELDAAHHIHPFTQTNALNKEGVRVIVRANGVYLWDSEGNKPDRRHVGAVVRAGGLRQRGTGQGRLRGAFKTLPYYNHFFKTTNPWTAELAAKLSVASARRPCSTSLFANSGSEANDTALKLIRYYWNLKGRPGEENPSVARPRLSRRHHGGGLAARASPDASAVGSAAPRLREGAGALLVRRQGGRLRRHRARTNSAC